MTIWRLILLAFAVPLLLAGCEPAADSENSAAQVAAPPTDEDVVNLLGVRFVYVEDGACEDRVTDNDSSRDAALVDRVTCEAAVPLLIAHLGDARPTWSVIIARGDAVRVPLGYLCLDILLAMSRADSPVFDPDAPGDDAFWSCTRNEFFFEPSILREGKTAPARMAEVRKAWEEAFTAGNLRFDPRGLLSH